MPSSVVMFAVLACSLALFSTASAQSCGYHNFNFTAFSSTELYALASDYSEIYYIRVCGTVTQLWCQNNQNTQNSQICQVSPGDTFATFNIASNDLSANDWTYVDGKSPDSGIQFTSATGDICPNGKPRVGIVQFMCDPSAVIPKGQLFAVEAPQCTYTIQVPTSLACASSYKRIQQA